MLRAMTLDQAKLASKFLKSTEDGKITLKDLNEFGKKNDCGVSFILARCKKEGRGMWSAGKLTDAIHAVVAGKPDPTGKAKAAPKVKSTKPKVKAKAKAKAKARAKAKKAHVKSHPSTAADVTPAVTS